MNLLVVKKINNEIITNDNTSCYRQLYLDIIHEALLNYENVKEFYINLEDGIPKEMASDDFFESEYAKEYFQKNYNCEVPKKILVMSKKRTNSQRYVLTTFWAIMNLNKINEALSVKQDFMSKYSKAIFRGSTTGDDSLWKNNIEKTRYQLIEIGKKNKSILDVGFTNIVQYAKENNNIRNSIVLYNELPITELCKSKYIIIPDGNVSTYSYFWALSSGSVVLKQKSEYIQFFELDENFKENEHYVLIQDDFSDIIEKINYLKKNEKIAKQITKNARNYAINNFDKNVLIQKFLSVII